MALTGTNRGDGGNNSSGSSIGVVPGSDCTSGALVILTIVYDNAGTDGADPYDSISDSKSNTWTPQLSVLNDPGAASAGLVLRIFTTPQDGGALTTGDTITVSFGATAVTAKVWTLQEFTGGTTPTVAYAPAGTTGTGTSATITTVTIENADGVVGATGYEQGSVAPVGDGDTSNGSWSVAQSRTVGVGASGQGITTQRKVVTARAAQTYNTTCSISSDYCIAYIIVTDQGTSYPLAGGDTLQPQICM